MVFQLSNYGVRVDAGPEPLAALFKRKVSAIECRLQNLARGGMKRPVPFVGRASVAKGPQALDPPVNMSADLI